MSRDRNQPPPLNAPPSGLALALVQSTDLPSKNWTVNQGWVLAANLANDLHAWTRLLGLHDQPDLAHAEPDTLRYRLWHLPARLTHHARQRLLHISETWPWAQAFLTCWQRLCQLPAPA